MKKLLSTDKRVSPTSWLQFDPALGGTPMDHLYAKLDGIYSKRWRDMFPTAMAIQNWKETWAQAFELKKLTPDQLKNGLKQCLDMFEWPPTLPQFLKACYTVPPAMHRNMPPPMLTGKATKEGTAEGLRRL